MLNNTNKYKFDFGNPVKFIISYIIEAFENLSIILLTLIALFSIEHLILENIPDSLIKKLFQYFF